MLKLTLPAAVFALTAFSLAAAAGQNIDVMSGGKAYQSYLSAPEGAAKKPAVILIHSFNGLEQGYKDLTDETGGGRVRDAGARLADLREAAE